MGGLGRGRALPHRREGDEAAFDQAVEEVAAAARTLIGSLVTHAPPRDRAIEAERAKARSAARFATQQ